MDSYDLIYETIYYVEIVTKDSGRKYDEAGENGWNRLQKKQMARLRSRNMELANNNNTDTLTALVNWNG